MMKVVLVHTPKVFSNILRKLFGISKKRKY